MEIIVNRDTGPFPEDAEVERLVREELRELPSYSSEILREMLGIDRWPLRP